MGATKTSEIENRVNTIKTDDDKKICESVETKNGVTLVFKQGEIEAIEFLRQALGKSPRNNPGRKGKKCK